MKYTIVLSLIVLTGCTLVPCNHVFPVVRGYWSDEAKRCRADQKASADAYKQWKATNNVPTPPQ